MDLLLLPGLSSAYSERMAGYEFFRTEAKRFGYNSTIVCSFPGQIDESGIQNGALNLRDSVSHTCDVIKSLEEEKKDYRILGFSYGSYVAVAAVNQIVFGSYLSPEIDDNMNQTKIEKDSLKYLERAVVYAPSTFSGQHVEVIRNIDKWKKYCSDNGAVFPENFLDSLFPFEQLLQDTSEKYFISVVTGTKDQYCSLSYFQYLQSLCIDKNNISFSLIGGRTHKVLEKEGDHAAYLSSLLSYIS